MFTTILKSFNTFASIATTTSSINLSVTGTGLIAIPISAATTCGLSVGNKVIYEIVMQKYIRYKKQLKKYRQTIKFFEKLNRKSLQHNVIDEIEYKTVCEIFTKYVDETENESFLQLHTYLNFLVMIN